MKRLTAKSVAGLAVRVIFLVVGWLALSACGSMQESRTQGAVEAQDGVGFTVIEGEDHRLTGGVQTDYEIALDHLEHGRHEEGVALLETVADQMPMFSAPRIDLGIEYSRSGNLEAAEQHLLLALESNPAHPVAHNELGILYRKSGRFGQARQSYESALEIFSGYHHARRNLAILCDLYLSDLNCALENYEAYLAAVPEDDEASMWLADIRSRIDGEAQ